MILHEYLSTDTNIITEGIKFFKTSSRITKFSNIIERKTKGYEEATELVKRIRILADEFRKIELQFGNEKIKSKRTALKTQYNSLKEKYGSLLDFINTEKTLKLVKGLGIGSVLAACFFGMYNFFYTSGFSSEVITNSMYNPDNTSPIVGAIKNIGSENQKNKGDFIRGLAKTASNLPDSDFKTRGVEYLNTEKNVSRISSLFTTLGVSGILAAFSKVFKKDNNDKLYKKTISIMERL